MAHQSALIAEDIYAYLQKQQQKDLLRFITCGSVDDGKSTLIGRLLWDSKLIFEDQLVSLASDSKKVGTQGDDIDYALLLDGLQAEREQGITIDVAHRFFSTDRRKFIVADTPGHEQYTRNMVTGASTAQVAVILIDARKGVLPQTNRHSYLAALVGIKKVLLAINKMDLVDYSEQRFNEIVADYEVLSSRLSFLQVDSIPLSALQGDNIITTSAKMPWYQGTSLLDYLETVKVDDASVEKAFRLPVQWVNRPEQDFRGYCGTITSGRIKTGDTVVVSASGQSSRVAKILVADAVSDEAISGQAVTLCLEDEIDISRGDLLSSAIDRPAYADQFKVNLVWMDEEALLPGRHYLLKAGTATVTAQVTEIKYRVNVNTLEHLAAKTLELNDIGVCNISTDRPIVFDLYSDNRPTGSFILIDRLTNRTIGAGMIEFALRRSRNIHWQAIAIDKQNRAELKGQQPKVLWFTGLSGSGKSTIANLVEKKLHSLGKHTYLLDGDNVRHGLNRDLGFTDADRVENIRRIAETAKLFVDAGIIVLTAFISPFNYERQMARALFEEDEFVEIYVDTPLEICEQRDPKGLYKKARCGDLKNFTGIDSAYEMPENPEIVASAGDETAEEIAATIVAFIGGGLFSCKGDGS